MGLSEDGDDNVEQRFDELCLDLNMDKNAKDEAWNSYQRIRTSYSLEGDQLHWLSCALYEACRRVVVPTVGKGSVEGNCVSLTRLLRSAKFSLIHFFNKMKKWADMANLSQEFRDKVDRLERNFAVSTVIFKKFEPIFLDIFKNPSEEPPRLPRSRKQRKLPCSLVDVFNFSWTMFVQVKGNFPAISDDLVNSYHLLLCNIDWFYANALLGGRKDLLNPDFSGLPENFHSRDWKAPIEPPCIIKHLCDKHEGLEVEAKVIKEHWWKPYLKKLFNQKVLKGKGETLSSVLEIGNFEINRKAINNAYEEYVLSVGDFDERIFLDNDAEEEIGTPAKSREEVEEKLAERCLMRNNLKQHCDQTRSLAPSTPLTGRRYLKEKDPSITPVSTATQSVSRLQHLLSGRQTTPSDNLLELCKEHEDNLLESITHRVKDMGEIFCSNYVQPSDNHPGGQLDFAKRRLQLAECLYYKLLESIILRERQKAGNCKDQKTNLSGLIEHEIFHRSLFACCLEIIIFSYNSQRMFPWIVDIFELSPYHFYKVIEIIVREEEGLSRDVVKHLNHIEESILEILAWKSDSPLWDAIKGQNNAVPSCEDVTLPGQLDTGGGSQGSIRHPALTRLVQEGRHGSIHKPTDPLMSPTGPSVTDRFSSPSPGSAKRRLFTGPAFSMTSSQSGQNLLSLEKQMASGVSDTVVTVSMSGGSSSQQDTKVAGSNSTTQIIAFQQAVTQDGRQVLIPLQTQVVPQVVGTNTLESAGVSLRSGTSVSQQQTQSRPRKTGSLALFFRKVYHLASVRLRDLCEHLEVDDDDLHKKMWTCLEHVLVNHIDLMQDRHLDQIIMCAIYVMAKVTNKSQSFQNIMKCYRYQPQAQSHVYRSVLLTSRQRHTSGSSDGSRAGASGSSSPVPMETGDSGKEKKSLPMRSTSTLPIPHPSSHPPTPTRLIGNGATFEFGEERGDLIQFYNSLFIPKVKKFAMKFSSQHQAGDAPPLSPLPMMRCLTASPRRVSQKHSVYISPHKLTVPSPSSKNGMHYCFNRSPAKNLRAINNMIKMNERNNPGFGGKRHLQVDKEEEPDDIPSKRVLLKRLQDVNLDRQEANGTVIG